MKECLFLFPLSDPPFSSNLSWIYSNLPAWITAPPYLVCRHNMAREGPPQPLCMPLQEGGGQWSLPCILQCELKTSVWIDEQTNKPENVSSNTATVEVHLKHKLTNQYTTFFQDLLINRKSILSVVLNKMLHEALCFEIRWWDLYQL